MRKINLNIDIEEYKSVEELSISDKELYNSAIAVALKAYAPYSKFQVGAALRLENGTIITGNNQENAAYPSGLCAERVALFYANANYPEQAVTDMAVVALKDDVLIEDVVTPCGSCRQALLETEVRFEQPIRIIMGSKTKIFVVPKVKSLLPLSFSGDAL